MSHDLNAGAEPGYLFARSQKKIIITKRMKKFSHWFGMVFCYLVWHIKCIRLFIFFVTRREIFKKEIFFELKTDLNLYQILEMSLLTRAYSFFFHQNLFHHHSITCLHFYLTCVTTIIRTTLSRSVYRVISKIFLTTAAATTSASCNSIHLQTSTLTPSTEPHCYCHSRH